MRTLLLQSFSTVLWILFGVVSLLVARYEGALPRHRSSWRLAGLAFLFVGLIKAAQNIFGSAAFAAGRGSELWNGYLWAAPAFDHSRTLALIVFFLLLLRRGNSSSPVSVRKQFRTYLLFLAGGALVGAMVGLNKKIVTTILHYELVAVLDAVELVVVLCVLFIALLHNYLDRILWFALSTYAFNLALNGIWMSGLAGLRVPGAWAPSPLYMHLYRVTLAGIMVGLSLWGLVLSKRRVNIPGLLEGARTGDVSLLK